MFDSTHQNMITGVKVVLLNNEWIRDKGLPASDSTHKPSL